LSADRTSSSAAAISAADGWKRIAPGKRSRSLRRWSSGSAEQRATSPGFSVTPETKPRSATAATSSGSAESRKSTFRAGSGTDEIPPFGAARSRQVVVSGAQRVADDSGDALRVKAEVAQDRVRIPLGEIAERRSKLNHGGHPTARPER